MHNVVTRKKSKSVSIFVSVTCYCYTATCASVTVTRFDAGSVSKFVYYSAEEPFQTVILAWPHSIAIHI